MTDDPKRMDADADEAADVEDTHDGEMDTAQEAPAPRKGGGVKRFFVTLFVIGILVGGAYATRGLWWDKAKPYLGPVGPMLEQAGSSMPSVGGLLSDDRVPGLMARLDALESAARTQAEQADQAGNALSQMDQGLQNLQANQMHLQQALADAGQRVAALEQALADTQSQLAAAQEAATAAGAATTGLDQARADLNALSGKVDSTLAGVAADLTALKGQVAGLGSAPAAAGAAVAPVTNTALAALEARVAALEGRPAGDPAQGQRLAALEGTVSDLAAKVTGAPAVDPAAVAALDGRVAALETARAAAPPEPAAARAMVVAAGGLRDALRSAAPFKAELAAFSAAGTAPEAVAAAVAAVAPRAETGIPTAKALIDGFDPVGVAVVRAARARPGEGIVDSTLNRLASLVTIRRTDGADDTPDGAVAKAESALAGGDLAAAVAALDGLEGKPAEAAQAWLADAQARLAADKAMAALRALAASLLTAGSE